MAAEIFDQHITDASAWMGGDMRQTDAWIHVLSADEIADLDQSLRGVQQRGLAMADVTKDDFPLPVLAPFLAKLENEVRTGRGFALLRGIPVENYTDEEVFMIKWGIGTHLGTKVSQNAYGDLLGHVFDHEKDPSEVRTRGYQTNTRLRFHVDRADMTSLLCLRKAKEGGMSQIVSSGAVHNKILAEHPEYLPPLYEGVPYIYIEEVGEIKTWKEPVFSVTDGVLSCSIRRNTVQKAIDSGKEPFGDFEMEALQYFDSVAEDPAFVLEMDMQPGDIQFVNNYTIMHGRSAFVDFPEREKRRHVVRLWLKFFAERPTADYIREQYNGIVKQADRKAS
jgi:hypothetical protein